MVQPVYALHLPGLSTATVEEAWSRVLSHRERILERGGVELPIEQLEDGNERLKRCGSVTTDQNVSGRKWSTVAWAYTTADEGWVRVQVSTAITDDGAMIDDRPRVYAPALVRNIIDDLGLSVDGRPLQSKPFLVRSLADIEMLIRLVRAKDRRLPIVAASRTARDALLIDLDLVAQQLAGLAYVVDIGARTTWELTERLGRPLSVFRGAVRIWWPGIGDESDPFDHPLWVPERLQSPASSWRIIERVRAVAVARYGVPDAETRLRRIVRNRELEEARGEAAEFRERSRVAASAPEYEELLDEAAERLEVALDRVGEAEERSRELESQVENLRGQLRTAQLNLQAVQRYSPSESLPDEGQALADEPPSSVLEAVHQAAARSRAVSYHQNAFDSAQESEFDDPQTVLDQLGMLEEVAQEWAQGRGDGDFRQRFELRTSNFRSGISATAQNQYPGDYELTLEDGRKVMMGPHLRKGTGAPTEIMRIYWWVDDENQKFIVGHVGKKLRDESNP